MCDFASRLNIEHKRKGEEERRLREGKWGVVWKGDASKERGELRIKS
jgi:hypothetical protein